MRADIGAISDELVWWFTRTRQENIPSLTVQFDPARAPWVVALRELLRKTGSTRPSWRRLARYQNAVRNRVARVVVRGTVA